MDFEEQLQSVLSELSTTPSATRETIEFWIDAFSRMEVDEIRSHCLPLVRIACWSHLSPRRLEMELERHPHLVKSWKKYLKRSSSTSGEADWLHALIVSLIRRLDSGGEDGKLAYLTRVLELLVDLLGQLPTRMFSNALIDDSGLVPLALDSDLYRSHSQFTDMVDLLRLYSVEYSVDDQSGEWLSDDECDRGYASRLSQLQCLAFASPDRRVKLNGFLVASNASLASGGLKSHLSVLSHEELTSLADSVGVRTRSIADPEVLHSVEELLSFFAYRYSRGGSRFDAIQKLSVYPHENTMWGRSYLNVSSWSSASALPLHKQNLQFLGFEDYLFRSFNLLFHESNQYIRQDIEDAILRLSPTVSINRTRNWTDFKGWSRMALPISKFEISAIKKPSIGEKKPSAVVADISVNVSAYNEVLQQEWDSLRPGDVLYLVSIKAPAHLSTEKWTPLNNDVNAQGRTFADFHGISSVRGCEMVGFVGSDGRVILDGHGKPLIEGERASYDDMERNYRVSLDTQQYQLDLESMPLASSDDVNPLYSSFNVLLRRKPSENNFKSLLETIRNLMICKTALVPEWLENIFLGYGDPEAAHYSRMSSYLAESLSQQLKSAGGNGLVPKETLKGLNTVNFGHTFLDIDHLRESFPGAQISVENDVENPLPPFSIEFLKDSTSKEETINVSPMVERYFSQKSFNSIRFTPRQAEAIRAGCSAGLTLVVGPPGTGKTEVAVQIMANIYRSYPSQRTLLITRSNKALNQIFEKLSGQDISPKHLLRLGHGEEDLEVSGSVEGGFGKYGRVRWCMARRDELLKMTTELAASLDSFYGDVGYSCETAFNFFESRLSELWYGFIDHWTTVENKANVEDEVIQSFPFLKYIQNAEVFIGIPMFTADSTVDNILEDARACWRHISNIFAELQDLKAFEILRSYYDRANLLLTKESKIVAMTSTHAAIKRQELLDLGFTYDNVIIEEAGQILEIESLIPLILQSYSGMDKTRRLKRVVMIGDNCQLPPVVKNAGLAKYSRLSQSLFERFIRLGVPHIVLDKQGRCRPSLRSLFAKSYPHLDDLPIIAKDPKMALGNPGLKHTFQFINVDDYMGCGESEPVRHFYQNVGEAEYVVAMFQYLRLLGYPASKITILTTYNGQRALVKDVLKNRCGWSDYFGKPAAIATVDSYQGKENDYILLSLVRTASPGYLCEIKRMNVAVSRARYGLYVFGRETLLNSISELSDVYSKLSVAKGNLLELVENERFADLETPKMRKEGQALKKKTQVLTIDGVEAMGKLVFEMSDKVDEMDVGK